MRWFFLSLIFLSIYSCSSDATTSSSTSQNLLESMPGTWETVSIKVTVNTAGGQDSTYIFDVPERDWEKKLGVQPIKTYYEEGDGSTYYSEYIDLDGTLKDETRGKWYVNGDSLRLVTADATYEYLVKINGGKGEFYSFLDWDGDGEDDDEYIGIQRKISNYTK